MRKRILFTINLCLVIALVTISLALGCKAPAQTTPAPAPTVTATATVTAPRATVTATAAPSPAVTATATVTSTVTATPAKTYTWKAIRGFPADSNDLAGWNEFLKRFNDRAKGRMVIQDIGGEEVYPAAQQFAPVKTGTVDMVYTSAGYIGSIFPEPTALMYNFGASHAQMRSIGVVGKLDEWARKEHGVTIIGMPIFGNYVLWITKPIKTLADLKSLKVRSHSAYNPLLQPLGIPTVTVSISELYTALERGVIDGAVLGNLNLTVYGIENIIRYRIDPPFWRAGHGPVFANLKSFEAVPADLQKLLIDTMVEVENEAPAMFDALASKENAKLKAAGIKPIRLTDEEWLQTQKIVWENGLPTALGKVAPEHKDEIMKLLSAVYPPKQPYPAVD